MQAYRQGYCEDGSQQQMYGSSSAAVLAHGRHSSSMQHQQHQSLQHQQHQSLQHKQQHQVMQHQSSSMQRQSSMQHQQQAMMHNSSSSSMKIQKGSQFSSGQGMTVFGQDPFCEVMPSAFPPGTDPKVIECYNRMDRDGNGVIDDMELQSVLSNCNHSFGTKTVHLLMYEFTHSNRRIIGPKEFVPLLKCLQTWRAMFQRFDRDRNGSIDSSELGQALSSLGYRVPPIIVNLLVSKFSKSAKCTLRYDSFIECCLTVKGLSETFHAKADCGKAVFGYEEFLLNVLPFVIA